MFTYLVRWVNITALIFTLSHIWCTKICIASFHIFIYAILSGYESFFFPLLFVRFSISGLFVSFISKLSLPLPLWGGWLAHSTCFCISFEILYRVSLSGQWEIRASKVKYWSDDSWKFLDRWCSFKNYIRNLISPKLWRFFKPHRQLIFFL